MTKGASEATVRAALGQLGPRVYVYKPPDDSRNWKPCDFMVWWNEEEGSDIFTPAVHPAWIEVKESPTVSSFAYQRQLRPSQKLGIRAAHDLGIPYLLVVHWRRHEDWTISDAWAVLTHPERVLSRQMLYTRYGVHAHPRDLAPTLRAALLEGLT
jgi:hypothetical protein